MPHFYYDHIPVDVAMYILACQCPHGLIPHFYWTEAEYEENQRI